MPRWRALHYRDHAGASPGQVVDVSLYEPLFSILGPQIIEYDQLRHHPGAPREPFTAHRSPQCLSHGG